MNISRDVLLDGIQLAGVVQLILVAANGVLPRLLDYKNNLPKLPPLMRQIYVVHSIYLVLVLLIFSGACLWFAPELAGGTPLGRFLCAAMAAFWLLRIPLQLFYYDRDERRRRRLADVAYTLAVTYLALVLSVSALSALQ